MVLGVGLRVLLVIGGWLSPALLPGLVATLLMGLAGVLGLADAVVAAPAAAWTRPRSGLEQMLQ
jgi:hypothetical protein